MTTGLKIKEVADASGFTAATLRYYEQIGLLPAASRTPAGYRMYDQRTLDRLAFIARAKQLGCSLDEITGLTAAWDGGQCGPIQDQLRQLVAGRDPKGLSGSRGGAGRAQELGMAAHSAAIAARATRTARLVEQSGDGGRRRGPHPDRLRRCVRRRPGPGPLRWAQLQLHHP